MNKLFNLFCNRSVVNRGGDTKNFLADTDGSLLTSHIG